MQLRCGMGMENIRVQCQVSVASPPGRLSTVRGQSGPNTPELRPFGRFVPKGPPFLTGDYNTTSYGTKVRIVARLLLRALVCAPTNPYDEGPLTRLHHFCLGGTRRGWWGRALTTPGFLMRKTETNTPFENGGATPMIC